MPVVTETLVLPGGDPPPTTTAIIQLAGVDGHPFPMGYGTAPDATTVGTYRAAAVPEDPDADPVTATWSVDLLANSTLIPTGTVWMVTLSGPGIDTTPRYFIVPDGGGPYDLVDLLTDPPASIAPTELAAHLAARGPGTHLPDGPVTPGATIIVDDDGIIGWAPGVTSTDLMTETAAREAGDLALSDDIDTEALDRTDADTALGSRIDDEAAARAAADLLLIPLTQRGAANGVPTLDGAGLIPTSQLPALAISSTFVVASQAAMLALTAEEGDVAVRTDLSKAFILTASPASTLGNWQELLTPTDAVLSVDGRSGTVSLSDLYDAAGAAAAAQAFARQRANHTGTQTLATISDAGTAAAANTGTGAGNVPTVAQADVRYKPAPVLITLTSSATPAIAVGTVGAEINVSITALTAAITSMTLGLTGTPTNFQKMIVRIKDDGTARAIAWGASYASRGAALPTTTVAGKLLTVGFLYNSVTSLWGCVAVGQEI